jgi:hypothetical protein
VQAGLVRRGPTRTVRGGTEQYFVRAAERFQFEHAPDALVAMMNYLTTSWPPIRTRCSTTGCCG